MKQFTKRNKLATGFTFLLILLSGFIGWRIITFRSPERMVKTINAAGGMAMPNTDTRYSPAIKVVGRVIGHDMRTPHQVWLKGPTITDDWLKRQRYFRGMKLESLMLSDSSLSHNSVITLIKEHGVDTFSALQMAITDSDVKLIAENNQNLSYLTLIQTSITDDALEHVQDLKQLISLGVAGTKVTPRGLLSLKNNTSLEFLNLDGRQLTAETVSLLHTLNIRMLILSGPDVTDRHLELITNLPSLKYLTTHHTSVTKEGVSAFEQANPQCEYDPIASEELWYQWEE